MMRTPAGALLLLLVAAGLLASCSRPMPPSPPRTWNAADGSVMLLVAAGPSIQGADDDRDDEKPSHTVTLETFYIGQCEVTNAQYARFVAATGYQATGCWRDHAGPGREQHPVICVTRGDASAYCRWAGLRLPTEAEWEKAARGSDGRSWPWGNTWERNRANSAVMDDPARKARMLPLRGGRGTLPVGLFPEGASPCGALDMAGNVWEWCSTPYGPYPGNHVANPEYARGLLVARGGGWHHDGADCLRCARRLAFIDDCSIYVGFRVCSQAPGAASPTP